MILVLMLHLVRRGRELQYAKYEVSHLYISKSRVGTKLLDNDSIRKHGTTQR